MSDGQEGPTPVSHLSATVGDIAHEIVVANEELAPQLLAEAVDRLTIARGIVEALTLGGESTASSMIVENVDRARNNLERAAALLTTGRDSLCRYLVDMGASTGLSDPIPQTGVLSPKMDALHSRHRSDPALYRVQARLGTLANRLDQQNMVGLLRGAGTPILTGELATPPDFLEEPGLVDRDEEEFRTQLLEAYDSLLPIVTTIRDTPKENLPDNIRPLGGGSYFNVYLYVDKSGKEIVIKLPKVFQGDAQERMFLIEGLASALIRTRRNPRFEHLHAMSYTDEVVATEYFSGDVFTNLTLEQLQAIPREHVRQLADDLQWARGQEVTPDLSGDNLLYNRERGFLIIDPHGVDTHSNNPTKTHTLLRYAAEKLGNASLLPHGVMSTQEIAARLQLVQEFATTLGEEQTEASYIHLIIADLQAAARSTR